MAGILRGARVVALEGGVALEVAELGRELPGFHVVAACGEPAPTGFYLDGQLFKVMLQVAKVCFFMVVSYDLSVRCSVG